MKIIKQISIVGIVVLALTACKKDKVPAQEEKDLTEACSATVSYDETIKKIMDVNCTTSGCHSSSSNAAGYNFESYDMVKDNASKILTAIKHEGGNPMPKGQSKLADSLIQSFECWVIQGKLNN